MEIFQDAGVKARVEVAKFEGSSGNWWYLKLKLDGHAEVWLNEHYVNRELAEQEADRLRCKPVRDPAKVSEPYLSALSSSYPPGGSGDC